MILGVFLGVLIAASGSKLRAESDTDKGFAKKVLYAIAILAVDTEVNAEHIVELRQRVSDLEIVLEKNPPPKD